MASDLETSLLTGQKVFRATSTSTTLKVDVYCKWRRSNYLLSRKCILVSPHIRKKKGFFYCWDVTFFVIICLWEAFNLIYRGTPSVLKLFADYIKDNYTWWNKMTMHWNNPTQFEQLYSLKSVILNTEASVLLCSDQIL